MSLSIEDVRYVIRTEMESLYSRIAALEEREWITQDRINDAINSVVFPLQERIAALPPIPVVEIPPISDESELPITIVEIPEVITDAPQEIIETVTEDIPQAIEEAIAPVQEAIEEVANAIETAQEIVTEEVPETIEKALETPIIEPAPDRGGMWTRPIFGGRD